MMQGEQHLINPQAQAELREQANEHFWLPLRQAKEDEIKHNLKLIVAGKGCYIKDAQGKEFNVDTYVPPVIPYAYDYLYKWYGGGKYGYEPKEELIPLLYTLYEADPPHP